MSKSLDRMIFGDVVIYPALRDFLKKSCYFMSYHPDSELIEFSGNHASGGIKLFELRRVSYSDAVTLAENLGLEPTMESGRPTSWSKWNPVYTFWDDGSEDARKIKIELLVLGLPFVHVRKPHHTDTSGRTHWGWGNNQHVYVPEMWTTEKVIQIIQEEAHLYGEEQRNNRARS